MRTERIIEEITSDGCGARMPDENYYGGPINFCNYTSNTTKTITKMDLCLECQWRIVDLIRSKGLKTK